MELQKDLREFIELLNSHDVKYLIVGGFAVAYHGYPRTTGDIDFFIEVSEENARKLTVVLDQFGFAGLGLTEKDFLDPGTIIQLGYPPNRIDLVTSISGVAFASAWSRRLRPGRRDGHVLHRQTDALGQQGGCWKAEGPRRLGCTLMIPKPAGEALDALPSQLPREDAETFVIVRNMSPDRFYSAEQRSRLEELTAMRRKAIAENFRLTAPKKRSWNN